MNSASRLASAGRIAFVGGTYIVAAFLDGASRARLVQSTFNILYQCRYWESSPFSAEAWARGNPEGSASSSERCCLCCN